jgi:Flp pilus assembly protein TadG
MPKVCSFARARNRFARQNGQSLVEFAMVLPLVLLLILGIVDFGQALNDQNDQANLANQAIRFADVDQCNPCTASDGGNRIVKYIFNTADSAQIKNNDLTICFFSPDGLTTPAAGDPVEVKVSSTYHWLSQLGFSFATSPVVATVVGRLEQPYTGLTYTLDYAYDGKTGTITHDPGCA